MSFKEGDIVVCIDMEIYVREEVSSTKCYKLYKHPRANSGLGFYDDQDDFRFFFPEYFRLATLLEKELANV